MGTGSDTLRIAICGCGNRSRLVWQRHVDEAAGLELVGVQDIAQEALDRAVELGRVSPELCFLDLERMIAETEPDAVLVCPVHAAHAGAVEVALDAGCHVLVEKPFTTDVGDAVRLTRTAEERGLVLGVVQNWRTKSVGQALRAAIADGLVGDVSHIFFRYVRDRELPHLPEYLFDEPEPLLTAVTIHEIDLFRWALADEYVHVDAKAVRPRWSRYREPSVMHLWLETERGVAISYSATFSSRNGHLPVQSLVVEGELGTLWNESIYSEPPLLLSRRGEPSTVDLTAEVDVRDQQGQYDLADRAILANFAAAVTRGDALISPARENLGTLVAFDAARRSVREGRPVDVREHASRFELDPTRA